MLKKIIIGSLLAILIIELMLRFVAGFGEVPVYINSMDFEYVFAPGQHVNRFHNSIITNEYSMRSKPLEENEIRVFKFGDSVLNGGVGTDQAELASTILEDSVQSSFSNNRLRVLNVSAGSWGPDNAFAWLKAHPGLKPELIILVFGSADWHDHMDFQDVVGNQPNYPEKQPLLALTDAANWIYSRYMQDFEWNELDYLKEVNNKDLDHNRGWDQFLEYAAENGVELWVYQYPNKLENKNKQFNAKGQKLSQFLKRNYIYTISGLQAGLTDEDFRDEIHPKPSGQAKIAGAVKPHLYRWIRNREP